MKRYQNIQFFDKNGEPLNFSYDEKNEKWTGSLYYPRVSTGLYEVIQLFMIEKFMDGNNEVYAKPHIHESSYGEPIIKAYWATSTYENGKVKASESILKVDEENIFLFQFDVSETEPAIEVIEELEIEIDKDPNEYTNTSDNIKVSDVITNGAVQISTAIKSKREDIYNRTLILLDTNDGLPIAEIYFYGETVGVDDRLNVLTNNMNYRVFNEDSNIFKDSDINEESPDNILLNRKKKEILLEGHNIYPYKGTYKGLINAIKFFGYNDLVVKEYWKNVNINSSRYGKYRHSQILDIFDEQVDLNDSSLELPNINYRKTGKFGLFYKINTIKEGYYDQYDLPIVEENSAYTLEEALIKLYGLKNRLKRDFLPGQSRIVDIVGEADYFDKKQTTVSVMSNRTDDIEIGTTVDFKVYPNNNGYIEDLRDVEDLIGPSYTPRNIDHDIRMDNEVYQLEEIHDVLLAYFTNYYPNINTIEQLPDAEDVPAGYLTVLENTSFNSTWNDAQVNWSSLGTDSNHIYDFIPVPYEIGNRFRIIDNVSGEYIEHTYISGETQEDIVDSLNAQWDVKYLAADLPWSKFLSKKVSATDGFALRCNAVGISTDSDFQYEWVVDYRQSSNLDEGDFIMRKHSPSNLYTWDGWGQGNFYDIEWIISKNSEDTGIPFEYSIRGDVADLNKLVINLPYVGSYDVQLRLYDTMNQISANTKRNFITVDSKEPEFSGYYRYKESTYCWCDIDVPWSKYGSTWELPIYKEATFDETTLSWETFDRSNSLPNKDSSSNQDIQTFRNDGSINYVGPYYWDNMTAKWDDSYHLWWNSTNVTGNTPANFRITSVFFGESLLIETIFGIGSHAFSVYDLEGAAAELNAETDEIIAKYIYNIVKDENGLDQFIQGVAKLGGENGDFIEVYGSSTKVNVSTKVKATSNNPTFNDIRIINNGTELPPLVHCSFYYNISKIPGKTKPKWSIINNTNLDFETITSETNILHYVFIEKGNYTIKLSLQDSNGNRIEKERNLILIK